MTKFADTFGIGKNKISQLTSNDIYAAQRIVNHPQYNRRSRFNDICLIRLSRDVVETPNIRFISLYTGADQPIGAKVAISGWGETPNSDFSDDLLTVNTNIMNNNNCADKTKFIMDDGTFCGGQGADDACDADSGGPAFISQGGQNLIVGIISAGIGGNCGSKDTWTRYTRISRYVTWIRTTIAQ